MVTLKVYGQLITWPEDFAQMMMKHYRNHEVPFMVYSNSADAPIDANAEGKALYIHLQTGTT